MKKSFFRYILSLLSVLIMLTLVGCGRGSDYDLSADEAERAAELPSLTHIINPDSEVRGVWIASVFNINFPSSPDLSVSALKAEIDDIIATCAKSGINTIYFQVRPSCDALYDSDIFPVSEWLTHSGRLTFDPLEYILDTAHRNNIFVHAWVNPLRVTVNSSDIDSLPDGSPAKEHPEWVVEYADRLYLNAGIPEVRSLVADGVREIVRKYDVDGVVFDDYFYPYPVAGEDGAIIPFDDGDTFKKYGGGKTLADWRRDNINSMIRDCYNAVHGADTECVFGVSPFGVWQNNDGKNGGSDTRNLEGYSELYCDALAWARGGYVDYLSPQLYWDFSTASSPFDVILRWWNANLDGTGVKLIVSHALHQYGEAWTDPDGIIAAQIEYARAEKTYHGSVCYGYAKLRDNYAKAADELAAVFKDEIIYTNIQSTGLGVTVSSPADGSVTYENKTYLVGSCDPAYPLTVDGTPISITKSGYFNMFVSLKAGKNVFVFEQNGKKYEYTITYKTSYTDQGSGEGKGVFTDKIEIVSVYPTMDVATDDETAWVHCVAPYGSTVTVSIGGVETELEAITSPSRNGTGYPCVTYGAEARLPAATRGRIKDCGSVVFSLVHKDGQAAAEGGNLRVLGEEALLCVRAKQDYTKLKITPTSLYYNDYTVQSAGMTDYACGLEDGFYLLRMGGYVSADEVEEITSSLPSEKCPIKAVRVTDDGEFTKITLLTPDRMPYNGCIDGGAFVVTFYNVDSETAPEPEIGKNPFFSSCDVIRLDGKVRYSFPLFDTDNFYGFDLTYGEGETVVTLRDPKAIDLDSPNPLEGITVVLDAGHGGAEGGAVGARINGGRLDEEDINLKIILSAAEKVSALGANVILTREGDDTVTLYERMDMLEALEPDLFVSIHQNSAGYSSDITRTRGTLGLWCMDGGVLLAKCVSRAVSDTLARWWEGTRYQMLAVCRNPKFPAALIEVGYMTSVEEYEQITSERGITLAADGVADGIIEYFRRQAEYAEGAK